MEREREQWGFTHGKSTTGALLDTTDQWFRELDDICTVFFDYSKAFDIVHTESCCKSVKTHHGLQTISLLNISVLLVHPQTSYTHVIWGAIVPCPWIFIVYIDDISGIFIYLMAA